jgi:eukaryotic-like serine/threonine-protein kinase
MVKHCTQCGEAQDEDARFCPRCGTPQLATPAAPAPEPDALLGKVIAERYLLVEKIGRGASGTIYRAEHTTLHKKVAVKVLHPQLSRDDTALERFRREATTVGQLDNDHILQVIDFGRADAERLFFAMEYLDGLPLSSVIDKEEKLAVPRLIDILTQVGEALIEAHGLGYIHRDLRPRNVFLITRRGRADFVKLLDFGLAKLVLPEAEAKQTAMGMTFGDPRYMSPEQARGDQLDRRADIYSLGAIAFEALTGVPPYSGGGTFEILKQHLDAPVPRPRDRRPDCPAWLDAVVHKALAKKPDERFGAVVKLLECLREQKAPASDDADEKATHASLSASATQLGVTPSPVAPAAVVAPAAAPEPAAASPKAATDAKTMMVAAPAEAAKPAKNEVKKETLFLSSIARAAPKDKEKEKPKDKKKEKEKREDSQRMALVRAASTLSGEMKAVTPSAAEPAPAPSVVVETTASEAVVPGVVAPTIVPTNGPSNGSASVASAAALPGAHVDEHAPTTQTSQVQAAPLPPPPSLPGRSEPSGEWFDKEFQTARAPGAVSYDELDDDLPKRNKGPIIIAAVAGGLTVLAVVGFLLLPKPEHKPLRGENATAPAAAAAPAPATPAADPAKPDPAAPAVAAAPAASAAAPAPAAPAPSVAAPAAPAAEPAKPEAVKAAVVEPAKPAPTTELVPDDVIRTASKPDKAPPPAKEDKHAAAKADKPEKSEKPAKVAGTEKTSDKKKSSMPEGFKDPFAEPAAAPAKATSPGDAAQADFFVKLGRQKLAASDFGAAAANFTKAREYDARSAEAMAGLGEVAFEQGDYNGAAVHLKQAVRLSGRARYLVLLGQAYYKMGRAKDAAGEYKKALRIEPGNQEAQHSLEVAERKMASGG